MLDGFKQMCGQFTSQTQTTVEKVLQNYTTTTRIFQEQEAQLKANLAEQKQESAIASAEREQYNKSRENVEKKIAEL